MDFFQRDDRRYARFARLGRQPGLVHAFSCRPLDVSVRQDERMSERQRNRECMARDLGLDPQRLHYCVQTHGLEAAVAESGQPAGPRANCDLIVTAAADEPLMTFSADCPLLLAYDPQARVLGLAHASWRCTVGGIAGRLVRLLEEHCGAAAARLMVGIGPSAGPCCYEVREDVRAAAAHLPDRDELFPRTGGRMTFDLWRANRKQLQAAGVPAGQIEEAGICTLCRPDLFYSFRREGAGCGHFGLMAAVCDRPIESD